MTVTGIIAEYNPFHKGHEYLLSKAREITNADYIVVVMSGAFVQRGEPAVLSKRARVRQALSCGADIVLELPVDCAMASAQTFARGGVGVLNACGIVGNICFGSESGDINALQTVADALSHSDFDAKLKAELASGRSYPSARQAVLEREIGDAAQNLLSPNNLLGIEYLLALKHWNSDIKAHTVSRIGAAHDSEDNSDISCSAFACRNLLRNHKDIKRHLPKESFEILAKEIDERRAPVFEEDMERAMLAKFRGMQACEFADIRDVSEGLENLIKKAVMENSDIQSVIAAVKSKRYTYSRIHRILMHAYLNLKVPSAAESMPEYIRLLGMKASASGAVKELKKQASLPVIERLAACRELPKALEREITATDIWGVFSPNPIQAGEDYRAFPVIE